MVGAALGYAQAPPTTLPLPAIAQDEAARIGTGWVLISQGKHQEAADYASTLLGQFPRSPAVLALAVEAAIAGRGANSALEIYERWLDGRTIEEPGVLGRIARAVLYEWARQNSDGSARVGALKALASAGVPEALDQLTQSAGAAEASALIELGNTAAIDRMLARLRSNPGAKNIEIRVLSQSRSPRVVRPLIDLLSDPSRNNRADAAAALGTVGQKQAIEPLKAVYLKDTDPLVRLAAAGALLQLGDVSGIADIRALMASEYAAIRRSALPLLAGQPDEEWKRLVRELAADPDPSFRLQAAKLIAPHDGAFSQSLLESLLLDANSEIRDDAGVILAQNMQTVDFQALRRLLRVQSGRVRVAAAERIFSALR